MPIHARRENSHGLGEPVEKDLLHDVIILQPNGMDWGRVASGGVERVAPGIHSRLVEGEKTE